MPCGGEGANAGLRGVEKPPVKFGAVPPRRRGSVGRSRRRFAGQECSRALAGGLGRPGGDEVLRLRLLVVSAVAAGGSLPAFGAVFWRFSSLFCSV